MVEVWWGMSIETLQTFEHNGIDFTVVDHTSKCLAIVGFQGCRTET